MDALDNWGLSRISLRKYLWKYILIYSIKSKKLSFIHLLWSCFTSAPLPLLSNRFDSLARLRLILHISKIWLIKFPFDLTELRSCNKADHQNLWPLLLIHQRMPWPLSLTTWTYFHLFQANQLLRCWLPKTPPWPTPAAPLWLPTCPLQLPSSSPSTAATLSTAGLLTAGCSSSQSFYRLPASVWRLHAALRPVFKCLVILNF